jgi:UDPglucose 6-dehydrogenase
MKILICGYGFVGKVHALALSNKDHDIQIYDPAYDIYKERLANPDAVVICVSTPQEKDGSCNIANVYECIAGIENDEAPILIKSTISLEGWRLLLEDFPNKKISFSPEFLRADYAWEDFKKQEVVYVGGGDNIFWASLLSIFLGVKVQCADPESLILAKYFRNSFLATKVAFFNQIEDLCNKAGVDGDKVCDIVTADTRIGTSHSYVYQDHERGFGGHCFPKDTLALLKTGEEYDYDLTILREAVAYNKKLRGEE